MVDKIKELKEKILNKLEGKIEVKLGECPFCNSDNYTRDNVALEEDFVRVDCICGACGGIFIEYFGLDEVSFDKGMEGGIYNNALSDDEKEIIKGWAEVELEITEEQSSNKGNYHNHKDKISRIINIMGGGLERE